MHEGSFDVNPKALLQRLHRSQRGQAAFEFLLMIPLLVGILLFVVDMGIAMYEYVSISNAVREGARYAAVNCDTGTCTVASVQARAAGSCRRAGHTHIRSYGNVVRREPRRFGSCLDQPSVQSSSSFRRHAKRTRVLRDAAGAAGHDDFPSGRRGLLG